MPLFNTIYQVDRDPDMMSYEATFPDGRVLMISPHLCDNHEANEDERDNTGQGYEDHRGYIDCTLFTRVPVWTPWGVLETMTMPSVWSISLELASAMVEGINEVAPWAMLNAETELDAYDKEKNPRIDIDVETDHHDMEEE